MVYHLMKKLTGVFLFCKKDVGELIVQPEDMSGSVVLRFGNYSSNFKNCSRFSIANP
jgi:hypothetical protein